MVAERNPYSIRLLRIRSTGSTLKDRCIDFFAMCRPKAAPLKNRRLFTPAVIRYISNRAPMIRIRIPQARVIQIPPFPQRSPAASLGDA